MKSFTSVSDLAIFRFIANLRKSCVSKMASTVISQLNRSMKLRQFRKPFLCEHSSLKKLKTFCSLILRSAKGGFMYNSLYNPSFRILYITVTSKYSHMPLNDVVNNRLHV